MPGKWGGARRARPPLDPPMVYYGTNFKFLSEESEIRRVENAVREWSQEIENNGGAFS